MNQQEYQFTPEWEEAILEYNKERLKADEAFRPIQEMNERKVPWSIGAWHDYVEESTRFLSYQEYFITVSDREKERYRKWRKERYQ